MNVQIVSLDPIPVVMLRRFGSYEQINWTFEQLYRWIEENGVPAKRTIAVYWDNPDFVPEAKLRSAACAEVPHMYQMPEATRASIVYAELPGGEYATTRYVGPYEQMAATWSNFTNTIEGSLQKRIRRDEGAMEIYVNDPEDTPPDQLITDLYMPVN